MLFSFDITRAASFVLGPPLHRSVDSLLSVCTFQSMPPEALAFDSYLTFIVANLDAFAIKVASVFKGSSACLWTAR